MIDVASLACRSCVTVDVVDCAPVALTPARLQHSELAGWLASGGKDAA